MTRHDRRFVTCFLVVCLACFHLGILGQGKPATHLRVELSTDKKNFLQGEPVRISVQVTNTGTESVFIGRDILWGMTSPSSLSIQIEAPRGREVTMKARAGDASPFRRRGSFANELSKCCIALLPGYSYGRSLQLGEFVKETDLTPGQYRIAATFSSKRIDADYNYNPLAAYPEEVAKLPYPVWIGEVKTNTLSIVILPENALKKTPK